MITFGSGCSGIEAIPVIAWLGKRIKKQVEYSEFDNL